MDWSNMALLLMGYIALCVIVMQMEKKDE